MRHADHKTPESINNVLLQLRANKALVERTPGSFYFKSKAFLHFREDPTGLFADVKRGLLGFKRMHVNTKLEQERFLNAVNGVIFAVASSPVRPKCKEATWVWRAQPRKKNVITVTCYFINSKLSNHDVGKSIFHTKQTWPTP